MRVQYSHIWCWSSYIVMIMFISALVYSSRANISCSIEWFKCTVWFVNKHINDMKITDDIFKSIFNESVWISITISLKFIPKGPIDYKSGSGNGLASNRRETITRINADPIHRRIYTALGGNKITRSGRSFTGVWYILFSLLHFVRIHRKYSILYLKRCLSVPSYYQYWLQIIAIHPEQFHRL